MGRKAQLILTKQNPASVDQSVQFVAEKQSPVTAIIIADNMFHTNNKDVLFMYDVAYENLRGTDYIIICGQRRYDLAVRMKLGGMDMSKIQICDRPEDIKACLEKTEGDICIMNLLHAENDAALMKELRKL